MVDLAPFLPGLSPVQGKAVVDPGVSDTEMKIGQKMPYSGPLSAASVIGKSESAYFPYVDGPLLARCFAVL